MSTQLQSVCKESEHCHQSAAEAVAAASFWGCGVFPCWGPLLTGSRRLITPLATALSVGFPENKMLQFTGRNNSAQISHKPAHPFMPSYESLQNTPSVSARNKPQGQQEPPVHFTPHCSVWVLDHLSDVRGLKWSLSLSFPVLGSINSSLLSHCF